jgi:DNA-binding NarL/FixJ family response regulator
MGEDDANLSPPRRIARYAGHMEGAGKDGSSLRESDTGLVRCLVVDDHPATIAGLGYAMAAKEDLELAGHATNGAEALRMAARRRPRVAIVDVRLPDMDGITLTRHLKAAEHAPEVLLYTGFVQVDYLEAGMAAGAQGFVVKSTDLSELMHAIREVAAGRPFVDKALTSLLFTSQAQTGLSRRETEVLQLLANGMTTKGVGEALFISPATVRSYAESAMHKLEATNRVNAVTQALRMRLIE